MIHHQKKSCARSNGDLLNLGKRTNVRYLDQRLTFYLTGVDGAKT